MCYAVPMNKIEQQLTFIKNSVNEHRNPSGKKLPYGIYKCSCGNIVTKWKPDVTRDKVKSCGNCNGHKMSTTRFYKIWRAVKTRTANINYAEYHLYGGRGIKMFNEWGDFTAFKRDLYESYLKHCSTFGITNTQIDRINPDGNYEPTNVRWVTRQEQADNKRNSIKVKYKGGIATIREIAKLEDKDYSTIYERYTNGKYERIIR